MASKREYLIRNLEGFDEFEPDWMTLTLNDYSLIKDTEFANQVFLKKKKKALLWKKFFPNFYCCFVGVG